MINIALGADHHGFALKQWLQHEFSYEIPLSWKDCGAFDASPSDYPLFAKDACQTILKKEADFGILLCGSGIGMAIAANRFKGIYAGLVWNPEIARLARSDDNCNVLVLAADFVSIKDVDAILRAWLSTSFKQGHYARRVKMMDDFIEK